MTGVTMSLPDELRPVVSVGMVVNPHSPTDRAGYGRARWRIGRNLRHTEGARHDDPNCLVLHLPGLTLPTSTSIGDKTIAGRDGALWLHLVRSVTGRLIGLL
jgi:hypothetical protein